MEPFILNRTDERCTRSVGRILGYALGFFVVTRILMAVVIAVATQIYKIGLGIDPQSVLGFLGSPETMAGKIGWWALPQVLIFAPLWEEAAFRLGLSFRRWQAAVGLGFFVWFLVSQVLGHGGIVHPIGWALPAGLAVAALLYFRTTEIYWRSKHEKWLRPMCWASAVLFGLAHLFAMSGLTWVLLPYALLMCGMLFFAGCVLVYLRINLGFWWAVGAHVLINVPAAVLMIISLAD